MKQITDRTRDHDAIWLLIPWYVNGRIDEQQRADVDAHLRVCQACRDELLTQQKIYRAMSVSHTEVEQLPTASLRRLLQKIDSNEQPVDIGIPKAATLMQQAWSWRWSGSMAASLAAVIATSLGFLAFSRVQLARDQSPADYYTVTSPVARAPHEAIRAVFAATTSMAELQKILNDAQLAVVAGPTPAGVYSLASTGQLPVAESLLQLRGHQQVLFAEPTAAEVAASQ